MSRAPRDPDAAAAVAWARTELEAAGIETSAGDAEIIVAHTLGLTRSRLPEQWGQALDAAQLAQVEGFVDRRKQHEPLQHLTGLAFFRELRLVVGPGVFVPRRETEFVTGLAIEALRAAGPEPVGVDLGTGAGAIALSLAVEVPQATVYGVELDPRAFEWTRRNFAEIAPERAHPVLGDLGTALPELNRTVDVVVGNPPFTPADDEPVTPEVRLWDPPVSWAGGADGFDVVRALSQSALRLLRPGGLLALEHGVSQAGQVAGLLERDGWLEVTGHRDPRGRDRVTTARRHD